MHPHNGHQPEEFSVDREGSDIYRFGGAMVAIKEAAYRGTCRPGALVGRIQELQRYLVAAVEQRHKLRPVPGPIPMRQDHLQPIHRAFIKTARRYPFRFAMGDQRAPQLNFLNISVRIVDPATREPLPLGQPGLMLVRGPNVMAGYLGRPQQTAEVLHGGW